MNDTVINGNVSPACPPILMTNDEKSLKTFGYACIMLLSLTGNIFVILIVYKNRTMHTTVNFLIANMAFSDLLQSIVSTPVQINKIFVADRWIGGTFGEMFCKCVPFLLDVSVGVSVLSLVLIAIDRFIGVVFPMRASSFAKRFYHMSLILASTWVISMAFHLPYFLTFILITENGITLCVITWEAMNDSKASENIFFYATSTCLFIFPLCLLIILYSMIFIRLTRHKMPGTANSFRNKKRIAKRNRNVLRMVLAVVITFVLCWLPLNTLGYVLRYVWTKNNSAPPCEVATYVEWAYFIAYSNASMTPCLYFLFSENYRQGLKQLFCKKVILTKSSNQSRPRKTNDGKLESSAYESKPGISLRSLPPSNSPKENRFNQCISKFTSR